MRWRSARSTRWRRAAPGLGIGSGIASAISKLGVDNKQPLAALRDTFQIVRGLLRGEEVSYSGTVFSADKVKLGYAPRSICRS